MIHILTFSPDGKLLVGISKSDEDEIVQLFNLQRNSTPLELKGHSKRVFDASFHPDGKLLATASSDGTVRLWKLELDSQNKLKKNFLYYLKHENPDKNPIYIYKVSFHSNGNLIPRRWSARI